ncbi:hypothetical protein [Primorskyibacter sp. 2E233]|uniref:hypothetical protein n=1 Tax=Primorskyibacter sp. 2E233 TaxID=3413431 RepID=UPI003BF35CB8
MWNRAALQDLLWSDRGPTHGRDSLKKALRELRGSLNQHGRPVLETTGGPVALDMTRIEADIFQIDIAEAVNAPGGQEFLAGLDVRDPEFEEWLRATRIALREQPSQQRAVVTEDTVQRHRLHLAVMPSQTVQSDIDAQLFGDMLLDRLIFALRHYDIYRVCDYRQSEQTGAAGADFSLSMTIRTFGECFVACLKCVRVSDNEVVWGRQLQLPTNGFDSISLGALITDSLDQISEAVFRGRALGTNERDRAARHAMDGIDRIFRLTEPELTQAAKSLRKAVELDPRSTYFAWFAYLSAFELEAKQGRNRKELLEKTEALARRALEMDRFNPLTRSLLTHVYGFLFRDFSRAGSLIAPLQSTPPDLPIYYQSLALLNFYKGNIAEAQKAAKQSSALGGSSRYAYWFETTRVIAETGAGNFSKAITLGENAISLQQSRPVIFSATLRYLAAAYALKGDIPAAKRVVGMIKAQNPNFSVAQLTERNFPIPSENARSLILSGLRAVGE